MDLSGFEEAQKTHEARAKELTVEPQAQGDDGPVVGVEKAKVLLDTVVLASRPVKSQLGMMTKRWMGPTPNGAEDINEIIYFVCLECSVHLGPVELA